jgi:putative phage-type endonuclease
MLIGDAIWYIQLLKLVNSNLFRGLDPTKKKDCAKLSLRICAKQPLLKRSIVIDAINDLIDRFKHIPVLAIVDNYPDVPVSLPVFTKKEIEKFKHYEKIIRHLESLPQHAQKTPGWFADRMKVITASSGATSIGECKYEKMSNFILAKCGINDTFTANANTHHGCKYEDIAAMIYERRKDVVLKNFGLILHPKGKVVGASPDGICSEKRRSGGYSPLVGRMLEIKCVVQRQILTEGDVDGDICPHYYWVQVQLQLECCSLDECDFWQCKITELSREDWCREIDINGMSVLTGMEMGLVIELLPRDKVEKNQFCQYEAKYLYPPSIGMSQKNLEEWIAEKKIEMQGGKLYKDNEEDEGRMFDYHKVIYWRLDKDHCELITKNNKWFRKTYPRLLKTWSYVLWFRKHLEEAKLWYEYSTSKKSMTEADMMKVADRLMNDNRRGSYANELRSKLASNKSRYVKHQDTIVFNMNDLTSLVNDSD